MQNVLSRLPGNGARLTIDHSPFSGLRRATIDSHHHLLAAMLFQSIDKLVTDCILPNNNVIIRFFAASRSPFLRRLTQRETASQKFAIVILHLFAHT